MSATGSVPGVLSLPGALAALSQAALRLALAGRAGWRGVQAGTLIAVRAVLNGPMLMGAHVVKDEVQLLLGKGASKEPRD